MSLQDEDTANGVELAYIWSVWKEFFYNMVSNSSMPWHQSEIDTIDNYKNVKTKYYFPTMPEITNLFAQHFKQESCQYGNYELAERCPIILFSN